MAVLRPRRAVATKTEAASKAQKGALPSAKNKAERPIKREPTPSIKKELTPTIKLEGNELETQRALQKSFTITPKTARLLMQAGFTDYRDLSSVSTSEVLGRMGKLPGMTPADAKNYRAAMRRLVYVGTLDEPATYPKRCTEWSRKGLEARGAWRDDFDHLTGNQVRELLE